MLQPGTIIDDRYEIRKLIGSGGMGSVFEAYHVGLDRLVAVKILSSIAPEAADDLLRFEREAVILSRLNHPNIVKFYAYGQFQTLPFIVMERLHGESLQTALLSANPPKPSTFLNYAIEICRGLECAHDSGIFHRDVKPSNVILDTSTTNGASVKLIDFGLAKLSLEWQAQKLTQTGLAVGSVMYMSPEQCTGQAVDARSDVYSVGCLLFHGLTGLPPFCASEAVGIMFQHLNQPINEAQGWDLLSAPLQKLIEKCMSKEPSKRSSQMAQVREELETLVATQQVIVSSASTPSIAKAIPRKLKNKASALLVVATAVVVAAVGAAIVMPPRTDVEKLHAESAAAQLYELVRVTGAEADTPNYIERLERCVADCVKDPAVNQDKLLFAFQRLGTAYIDTNKNEKAKLTLEQAFARCTKTSSVSYKNRLVGAIEHYVACKRLNIPEEGMALLESSLKQAQSMHSTHYSRAEMALANLYLHDNKRELAKSRFEHAGNNMALVRRDELIEGMELAIQFGNVVKLTGPDWIHDSTPVPQDDSTFNNETALAYLQERTHQNETHLCTTDEAAKIINALEALQGAPDSAQRTQLLGYHLLEYFYEHENNYQSAAKIAKAGMDKCTTIRPESRGMYARLACANYTDTVKRNLVPATDHYIKIALRNLPEPGPERSELQLVAAGIALEKNDLQTAHNLFVQCAPNLTILKDPVEVSFAFDLARQFGISMFEQLSGAEAAKRT